MPFFYLLEPLKEFVNLDNNLTDQLLSLQAKAVELGLLAQKFEDEGNAYYVLSQTGVRTIIFLLPRITAFLIRFWVLRFCTFFLPLSRPYLRWVAIWRLLVKAINPKNGRLNYQEAKRLIPVTLEAHPHWPSKQRPHNNSIQLMDHLQGHRHPLAGRGQVLTTRPYKTHLFPQMRWLFLIQ